MSYIWMMLVIEPPTSKLPKDSYECKKEYRALHYNYPGILLDTSSNNQTLFNTFHNFP